MNSNITMSDPESSCKYFLYRTVGSADQVAVEAGFKVCDLAHLAPSALTIAFLLYSLPRTRHKLSGAPPLVAATHIQLYIAVTTQIVRCLLMFMCPSPNSDPTSAAMEKVSWALSHGSNTALEITAFVIFFMPVLPSAPASRRILGCVAAAASLYTLVLAGAELGAPAPEFHVSRLNLTADLYGAGGPGLVLATALLAALAYSSLISLRVFQKSGSRRSSTFTYSIVMLGVQGTRTLGAILLAAGVQFGLCLLSLTFFLLIEFLPPLVFLCVLCPYLQTTQSHSLLQASSPGYRPGLTEDEDWLEEDDYDLYTRPHTLGSS